MVTPQHFVLDAHFIVVSEEAIRVDWLVATHTDYHTPHIVELTTADGSEVLLEFCFPNRRGTLPLPIRIDSDDGLAIRTNGTSHLPDGSAHLDMGVHSPGGSPL